jgi:hypothetical protein
MQNIVVGKILTLILVLIAVAILAFTDYGSRTVVYDCGMAEWHPDVPAKVKEECRKLRKSVTT